MGGTWGEPTTCRYPAIDLPPTNTPTPNEPCERAPRTWTSAWRSERFEGGDGHSKTSAHAAAEGELQRPKHTCVGPKKSEVTNHLQIWEYTRSGSDDSCVIVLQSRSLSVPKRTPTVWKTELDQTGWKKGRPAPVSTFGGLAGRTRKESPGPPIFWEGSEEELQTRHIL